MDRRPHHVESDKASTVAEITRGHIVALDRAPTKAKPMPADADIKIVAEGNAGI